MIEAQHDEVELYDEANALLAVPGMDVDHLQFKVDHYTKRMHSLKDSHAPEAVVNPVVRLQRKFLMALNLKRNADYHYAPVDQVLAGIGKFQ